ncbi:MAG: hypothetical protein WB689_23695 [Xanthobacteraceae bacterium]
MFGWLRNNEKQLPVENIASAYEFARRTAESASADIKAYVQAHFYPSIPGILDAVFADFENPDVPPFVLGRTDLKIFLERLDDDLRPRVLPQLLRATAGWDSTMKQAGLGAEFECLIEQHYNRLKSALVLAAFQRFLDMTDILKAADDKWRAANPEKAAQIPFDALGPELGDVLIPYLEE